uniref:Putative secreted protein n=1 Tax=Ixodes ricinus TaxID=34613 RepID=A0A6B0UA13_IXORI
MSTSSRPSASYVQSVAALLLFPLAVPGNGGCVGFGCSSQHPPVCCWKTSMVSSSSMSSPAGVSVSLIGCPSNRNLTFWMLRPALSQYVVMSFRNGVCFLILK